MHDKSLSGIVERNVFTEHVKVVKRMSREGQTTDSVIIELPRMFKEKLSMDGCVYVGWSNYKVNV